MRSTRSSRITTRGCKSTVMPRARDDFKLPPELYADNLKNVGLDIAPDALIAKAELAYAEIRNEMQAIAPLSRRSTTSTSPTTAT